MTLHKFFCRFFSLYKSLLFAVFFISWCSFSLFFFFEFFFCSFLILWTVDFQEDCSGFLLLVLLQVLAGAVVCKVKLARLGAMFQWSLNRMKCRIIPLRLSLFLQGYPIRRTTRTTILFPLDGRLAPHHGDDEAVDAKNVIEVMASDESTAASPDIGGVLPTGSVAGAVEGNQGESGGQGWWRRG